MQSPVIFILTYKDKIDSTNIVFNLSCEKLRFYEFLDTDIPV